MAVTPDTFFVTVKIHATCTPQIPAEDCEAAIRLAHKSPVLDQRSYGIEKEIVRLVRFSEGSGEFSFTAEKC
jgi:hypothetical protein